MTDTLNPGSLPLVPEAPPSASAAFELTLAPATPPRAKRQRSPESASAAAKKKADLLNLLTWASENGDPEHKAIALSLLPSPKEPKAPRIKPLEAFKTGLEAIFKDRAEVSIDEALKALSLPSLEAFSKLYRKLLDREEEGRLWVLAMANENSGQPGKLFLLGRGPVPPPDWTGYVPLRRKP